MPTDPGYTTVQYRMTAAHARYLRRVGGILRTKYGLRVEDHPLRILEWCAGFAGLQLGDLKAPPRTANTHGGARRGKPKQTV